MTATWFVQVWYAGEWQTICTPYASHRAAAQARAAVIVDCGFASSAVRCVTI